MKIYCGKINEASKKYLTGEIMAGKTSDFKVKQKQLNTDCESKKFRNMYLIYGEEAYLVNQNKHKLKDSLVNKGDTMNFTYYAGKNIDVNEVIDMARTIPFFADRRTILIEDSGFFKSGCADLAKYLKTCEDTTVFVFVESEVDKRKDMYKAVNEHGLVLECDRRDESDLTKWIAFRLKKENLSISASSVNFMLERVGTDMFTLSNELEKLINYADGKTSITSEDIDIVCANYLSNRIFAMMDAVVAKNQKKAMDLYYELLALKEAPQKISALIFRQFNLILQVKEMAGQGFNNTTIGKAVGLPPFIIGKYVTWARNYSKDTLKEYLEFCVSNDEKVKSGKLIDTIGVEMLLVKCTSNS